MPDLKPFDRFMREMNGVERRFIAPLLRDYRDFRRDMLDFHDRNGLSVSFLRVLSGKLDLMRDGTNRIALETLTDLRKTTRTFVEAQVAQMPNPPAVPDTSAEFRALSTLQRQTWIDTVRARFNATVPQIEINNDPKAIERLFATRLVDDKASVWRLGRNSLMIENVLTLWTAANVILNGVYSAMENAQPELKRQAIAAIDENTTACCLNVHGQIVGMNERFKLSGEPKFASALHSPPFHWHCRTSVALWHPTFEDSGIPTSEMEGAAAAERDARKRTGKREEIHPAHATSRRK